MPTFVQLVTFYTQTNFDMWKDTKTMNEVLSKLQQNGAKIQKISPSLAAKPSGSAIAAYCITYEADNEINVK